jgi:hypothetical protein
MNNQAAVLYAPHEIRLEERPQPQQTEQALQAAKNDPSNIKPVVVPTK